MPQVGDIVAAGGVEFHVIAADPKLRRRYERRRHRAGAIERLASWRPPERAIIHGTFLRKRSLAGDRAVPGRRALSLVVEQEDCRAVQCF